MNADILARIAATILHRLNEVEAELQRLALYLTDEARMSLSLQLIDLEEQLDYVYELHQTSLRSTP